MSVPRVSIVVTCYNLGPFLAEAVASVRSQTFQDLEIVIVDDGSDDSETGRALDEQRQAGARVLRTENRGLSAARNWGASHTSGEFLCMVDADDLLAPTMLEKSVAVLDDDPSTAFVSHWLRTFGDEAWDWTPTSCDLASLLDKNVVNGAALMRRAVFDSVGGFDESMRRGCEDWDFWISAVEKGFRGHIIPEVLFHYRRRPESMSRAMMEGSTFAELYGGLARKHADSFKSHVEDLVVSRERELFDLRAHAFDLEAEYTDWLALDLMSKRDEVARLERRTHEHGARTALASEQAERDRERTAAREDLRLTREELGRVETVLELERQRWDQERTATASALSTSEARAGTAEAGLTRAHEEVEALRASWSWRLTSPLRWIYDLLRSPSRS